MRMDIPKEQPRHRTEPPSVAPVEPSPLDQRRVRLQEQAEQRRMPQISRPRRERSQQDRSRIIDREPAHDPPMERRQK